MFLKAGLVQEDRETLGDVHCLGHLEEAVHEAVIVIEAVSEDMDCKMEAIDNICKHIGAKTILASSTLRY